MITVYTISDALEPKPERHEVDALIPFLMSKWSRMPEHTAIYHQDISQENNVTPKTQEDVDRLASLPGPFYVVTNPGDVIFWAAIVLAAVVVAAVVLMPKPNIPSLRNTQAESPNNGLSARENNIRLNGRIPDIYGQVISTPDLITVPYFVYVNHRKVEYADMCVGRGAYEFAQVRPGFWEIKDGDTLIQEIDEAGIEVYAPNTTVDSSTPQIKFGSDFVEPMRTVKRIEAVNGQTLQAYNENSTSSVKTLVFTAPNTLTRTSGSTDLTQFAQAGQRVSISSSVGPIRWLPGQDISPITAPGSVMKAGGTCTVTIAADGGAGGPFSSYATPGRDLVQLSITVIANGAGYDLSGTFALAAVGDRTVTLVTPGFVSNTWAALPDGTFTSSGDATIGFGNRSFNSNGTYTVQSVAPNQIIFSNPIADNPEWYYINGQYIAQEYIQNVIFSGNDSDDGDTWIGPFTMNLPNTANIIANIVAPQGMYKDNGEDQTSTEVEFTIELQQVDAAGNNLGAPLTITDKVVGSALNKSERAKTVMYSGAMPVGTYKVRAKRLTLKDTSYKGTVVDEIKWADLYAVANVQNKNFGNVTIIRSKTTATTGALAVKSRKLNCRVTRKVRLIAGSGVLTAEYYPTKRVADIFADMCLDPFIGNRQLSEIDLANFKTTGEAIETYFGHEKAQEFCYTLDKPTMSFEETAELVANAVFSVPYREGNRIKLKLERSTDDSILLFGHRNKLPGSEKRTYRFGTEDNTDGVELEYVAPEDFASVNYYIPIDRSAIKPKKVDLPGVANPLQAYFHAWRAENKRRYRRLVVEFEALQEAEILVRNDRILVADNTRAKVNDGEIVDKQGLVVSLSQPTTFTGYDSIFLQHIDGSVENIGITNVPSEYTLTLAHEPRMALSLDPENYALCNYWITNTADAIPKAFLVQERDTQENMTSKITAYNYDSRYYQNDDDFKTNVINANGQYI